MDFIYSGVSLYRFKKYSLLIQLLISILFLTGFWNPLSRTAHQKSYSVQEAPTGLQVMHWPKRRDQLRQVSTFKVEGSLETRVHCHQEVNFIFQWEQSRGIYKLTLSNTEDKERIELIANKKQAKLRIHNKIYYDENAELLLKKHLGINLPVNYFSDWIKGVPTINVRHERVLNPSKHLLTLNQGGWFIRYLRYHKIRQIDLPTQLYMMHKDWYVRILITHWRL